MGQIRALEAEQKAAKPLTTQFIKRQPRLSKPLELKKRTKPRRRQIRREMVSAGAQARRKESASLGVPTGVIGNLAKPSGPAGRAVLSKRARLG